MYSYIIGIITEIMPSYVVVDNNGIGYRIYVPNPFFYKENESYKVYLYKPAKLTAGQTHKITLA